MSGTVQYVISTALMVTLSYATAWAQGGTAQINGRVSDPTGAVLPGVEVTATQTDTGVSRLAVTNESGSFVLPNLAIGPYSVEASLPGFRTFRQTGIVLQVNSSVVINPTLEVGNVAQTIEVQANAAMVETRATGVGSVIDNAQILELPLLGRQVTDLVVLAGAAVQTGVGSTSGRTFPGVPRFSIAGSLSDSVSVTLDGASHNGVRQSSGMPLPFPDALQEFKVETSAVPAQYGFRGGGAINAVTKSGTNEFHGAGWWFARRGRFNARNFFAVEVDPLKRNQFGGTLGGPIRQNRVFFFAGYEGTTTRAAPTDSRVFVPTPAMMAGDFTTFASAACQGREVPLRAPFVDNVLPQAAISPAALNVAQRLASPINECGEVVTRRGRKNDHHMAVGKLDYHVSSNRTIFVRYMGAWGLEAVPAHLVDPVDPLVSGSAGKDDLIQNITIGDTLTINPNIINAFRAGWNREVIEQVPAEFFNARDVGVDMWQPEGTQLMSIDVASGFRTGAIFASGAKFRETGYQLADDLGVIAGGHQFNFGVNWMAFQTNNNSIAFTPGHFAFNGSTTGLGLADFMAGRPSRLLHGGPSGIQVRTKVFALYAQDSWQVRPALNLSLGLRWEPTIAQRFADRRANYFDWDFFLRGERSQQFLNAPAGIFYPGDAQFPVGGNDSTAIPDHWDQFAPRIGVSWDPFGDGRTVVRGAFGSFFEIKNTEFFMNAGSGPPWGRQINVTSFPGGFDDPYRDFPGGNPFPFVLGPDAPYPQEAGVFTLASGSTDVQTPNVLQWNFGIQREIAPNWLVSASYIGNKTRHLAMGEELNRAAFFPGVGDANGNCFATVRGQAVSIKVGAGRTCSTSRNVQQRRPTSLFDPTGTLGGSSYGWLILWNSDGERSYNGMLLKLDKRMSQNFSASFNYTWSHCITTPSDSFLNASTGRALSDPTNLAYDRGNCGNKHIANATGVIQMPQFSQSWVQRVFGDWRVSGIFRTRSGDYDQPTLPGDPYLGGNNRNAQRPNQLLADPYGNQCKDDLLSSAPTCVWYNPDAFSGSVDPGTFGNVSPGTLIGPGRWTLDAGLSRTFRLGEVQRVEFRAEASNVLNHTNLANPRSRVDSRFGRITSALDPRIMQFALKYIF